MTESPYKRMAFKKGRKGPKSRFNRFNHNHDSGFSRFNANSGDNHLTFSQERQGSQVLQDDPAVPELGGAALHHAARRVVRRSSLQGDKDLHLGAQDEHGAALLQPGMFINQVKVGVILTLNRVRFDLNYDNREAATQFSNRLTILKSSMNKTCQTNEWSFYSTYCLGCETTSSTTAGSTSTCSRYVILIQLYGIKIALLSFQSHQQCYKDYIIRTF